MVGTEWINTGDYNVEELTSIAKWAEKLELFPLMAAAVGKILDMTGEELSSDLRNMFSVAQKNLVGEERTACRMLRSTMSQPQAQSEEKMAVTKEVLASVCAELMDRCDNVLKKIDVLIEKAKSDEATVFLYKMKGDYHRYRAEVAQGEELDNAIKDAEEGYAQAAEKAKGLPPTHPVALGLQLNRSVFFYEIKANRDLACECAQKAFDDAIAELDTLQEESYKDSTLIMQLLRDNLTLWKNERPEGEDGGDN